MAVILVVLRTAWKGLNWLLQDSNRKLAGKTIIAGASKSVDLVAKDEQELGPKPKPLVPMKWKIGIGAFLTLVSLPTAIVTGSGLLGVNTIQKSLRQEEIERIRPRKKFCMHCGNGMRMQDIYCPSCGRRVVAFPASWW